jgi:hypothetical protein
MNKTKSCEATADGLPAGFMNVMVGRIDIFKQVFLLGGTISWNY